MRVERPPVVRGRFWRTCLPFIVLSAVVALAQAPAADPAYVVRGRQTEVVQRAFTARLERFHTALADTLRRAAPDLLPRLDPPPAPAVTGYQLLPRIVPEAPTPPRSKPQATSFYWGWSDTLYARETRRLEQLEADLAGVAAPTAQTTLPALEALIAGYRSVAGARRSIDADVGYNWLWQREIANDRARFDAATQLIDAALAPAARDAPPSAELLAASAPGPPLPFVRVESPSPHVHVVTVPMYTDIADDAFVKRFTAAAEGHWTLDAGDYRYRVRLDIARVSPERLYCGVPAGRPRPGTCAPPAKGDRIDLDTHIARFPPGRAVLTTGATALHARGRRAIALTPFDVTPRALAHELGHVLGFPDAYLRGYRDLGDDGFRVIELVPDLSNIMAAPGFGSVLERHFQQLIAAIPAP
jgi:hypothetical protein